MDNFSDMVVTQAMANSVLDKVKKTLFLKNDAALCRTLSVTPPLISNVRAGRRKLGATLFLSIMSACDVNHVTVKRWMK